MRCRQGVLADEHAQNPGASPHGGMDLTSPLPGQAVDSWPGIAAPLARVCPTPYKPMEIPLTKIEPPLAATFAAANFHALQSKPGLALVAS